MKPIKMKWTGDGMRDTMKENKEKNNRARSLDFSCACVWVMEIIVHIGFCLQISFVSMTRTYFTWTWFVRRCYSINVKCRPFTVPKIILFCYWNTIYSMCIFIIPMILLLLCVFFFSYRWGKKSYVPFTLITPTWQKNKHTNTYILTSQQKGILMIHISRTVTKQLMTHTQIQQLNTTWNQTYRTKHRTKLTHITHKIVFARISASSTPAFTCTI